jgi:pantetheine-phosphate adenylyltransferase
VGVAAVCPGSFDPITMGHLDIVRRAAGEFDRLVVAVLDNPRKTATAMFSAHERMELIRACVADLPSVEVDSFSGLLVDFCRDRDITVVCKGLRAVSDFEYELQMAQMNQRIGGVETLFMSTSPEYSYLSSSLIKEVAKGGGTITGTVPPEVEEAVRRRLAEDG